MHTTTRDTVKARGNKTLINTVRADKAESLDSLRSAIARIEGIGGKETPETFPVGAPAIDRALPWGGMPRACVHEVTGASARDKAALGFTATLLHRCAGERPILWIGRDTPPYAPALPASGLDPAQILFVRATRPTDLLWSLDEAVRCRELGAVFAEGAAPGFAESRRLQLAAAETGVTVFLLRSAAQPLLPSAAVTRWHVTSAPAAPTPLPDLFTGGIGRTRWRVNLFHCRGGRPADWLIQWDHETNHIAVAADARDRSAPRDDRRAA